MKATSESVILSVCQKCFMETSFAVQHNGLRLVGVINEEPTDDQCTFCRKSIDVPTYGIEADSY